MTRVALRRGTRQHRPGATAAVPVAAPHGVRRGARRRWERASEPRRGDARSSRDPVPRRARRVPAASARRSAPAARRARGVDRPAAGHPLLPCRLRPGRVHQPVSVRTRPAGMCMRRGRARSIPTPAVSPAARPLRPAPLGRATGARRPAPASRRRASAARVDAAVARQRARLVGNSLAPQRARTGGCARALAPAVGRGDRCTHGRDRGAAPHRAGAWRGSAGWRERSPTSTTRPRSRRAMSSSRRSSGRTCRERRAEHRRDRRGGVGVPPAHDTGATARAARPLRRAPSARSGNRLGSSSTTRCARRRRQLVACGRHTQRRKRCDVASTSAGPMSGSKATPTTRSWTQSPISHPCCSAKDGAPRRSKRHESRSSARVRRPRTGSPTRESSAATSPPSSSPSSAAWRSGSTAQRTSERSMPAAGSSGWSRPGSTSRTRAATPSSTSACERTE